LDCGWGRELVFGINVDLTAMRLEQRSSSTNTFLSCWMCTTIAIGSSITA
jgi:hypothetical protein